MFKLDNQIKEIDINNNIMLILLYAANVNFIGFFSFTVTYLQPTDKNINDLALILFNNKLNI